MKYIIIIKFKTTNNYDFGYSKIIHRNSYTGTFKYVRAEKAYI